MATRGKPRQTKAVGVSVYDFLDFRAYLRAYYDASKRTRPSFSFRAFSKLAGLKSPNFLKLVMDGERNLGADSVQRFADAIGLSPTDAEFFQNLVAFGQAGNMTEKNRAFELISASRRFRQARRIDGQLFEYLSHWYNPAIRELAARSDFQEDPRWIAEQMLPRISVHEAADAMKLLLSLGLLVRDATTGRVLRGEPTLTTEHEVRSLAVTAFHRQMLERAGQAIELVPRELRDLCALTVCVSAATAASVKQRVHEFREAITELCDSDTGGNVVYQLNVQWFSAVGSWGGKAVRIGQGMRLGWLLGLLSLGCGPSGVSSTGVGNPGISMQLSVYTDDELESASAGAGGASSEEPLPREGVLNAQLSVGALRFRPCDSAEQVVNVPGPFVIDLIKREVTPAIPQVPAIEGGYCGIDAPLRRALRPAGLFGRSLLFEGTREDGIRFVLFSDMTATLRLRARAGQVWDPEQTPQLLWAFRPRRWLSTAEVNSADALDYQGERAIVIDVDRHPLLYLAIRGRLAGRSALYPDLNENGVLDAEERALPLGDGLEDAD